MTDRTFDFTRTTRVVTVLAPVAFVAWLGTALWTSSEQPRRLVLGGAVLIGIGALVYGLRAWRKVMEPVGG